MIKQIPQQWENMLSLDIWRLIYFYLGWEDKPKIEDLFSEDDILWKLAIRMELEAYEIGSSSKTFYKNYTNRINTVVDKYAEKLTDEIAAKLLGKEVFKIARAGLIERYKMILRNDIGTSYVNIIKNIRKMIIELCDEDILPDQPDIDDLIDCMKEYLSDDMIRYFCCWLVAMLSDSTYQNLEREVGEELLDILRGYFLAIKY